MSGPLTIGRRTRWAPGPNAKVNWSHPLASGLLYMVLPNRGRWREIVTNQTMTLDSEPPNRSGQFGPRSAGGTYVGATLAIPAIATPNLSFTVGMERESEGGWSNPATALFCVAPTTNVGPYGIGLFGHQDVPTGSRIFTPDGTTYQSFDVSLASPSSVLSLTIANGAQTVYQDGTVAGSASLTVASVATNCVRLCVATLPYDASRAVGDGVSFGIIHGRTLSSVEVAQLYADPFCMLEG